MSEYAEIEPRMGTDDVCGVDEVVKLATEEHNVTSPKCIKERAQWLRVIVRLFGLLQKVVSLIFFSMSERAQDAMEQLKQRESVDITDQLLAQYQTGNNRFHRGGEEDGYERVFQHKIMCLESMQLPSVLVERYRTVHDPEIVATVDKAVNEMHACRASMGVLKYAMESKSDAIMESSAVLWKERMDQHNSIIHNRT